MSGKIAVGMFQKNPKLSKEIGFIRRKQITEPLLSSVLAELIGVILGDGSLPGNHPFTISFNRKTGSERQNTFGSHNPKDITKQLLSTS